MIDPNLENLLFTQKLKLTLGEMQFQILLAAAQVEARDQHIKHIEDEKKEPSKPPK